MQLSYTQDIENARMQWQSLLKDINRGLITKEQAREILEACYGASVTSEVVEQLAIDTAPRREKAEPVRPDREALLQYLGQGFELGITFFINGNKPQVKNSEGQRQYDRHRVLKNWVDLHNVADGELIKITDAEGLDYWLNAGYSNFNVIPKQQGFICLDIDRGHADKQDGLKNLYVWMDENRINIPMLKDIEKGSHPVYVETPSGGFHLYFKTGELGLHHSGILCNDVEVKYTHDNLTCGGSIKNGRLYKLHGNLADAPQLPQALKYPVMKVRPTQRQTEYKNRSSKAGLWSNKDISEILQEGRDKAQTPNPHHQLYSMAIALKVHGFSKQETMDILQSQAEHLARKDKADTYTAINSVYNKVSIGEKNG